MALVTQHAQSALSQRHRSLIRTPARLLTACRTPEKRLSRSGTCAKVADVSACLSRCGIETAMRLMLKPFGLSSKVVFDDPDGLPTAPLQRLGCCSPHGAFPVMTMSFGMFRFRNDPALRHFRLRNAGATHNYVL